MLKLLARGINQTLRQANLTVSALTFAFLGLPSYGVSGLFLDPRVDARAHGRDERMRIQSYYEGQEFLYRLTKALTSSSKPVP